MKLTVALRVIGGFGVISLLLLIIGFTSYNRLNTISTATTEVNNVSIPALENSATMKSQFVIMSKLSLQAFNAEDINALSVLKSQFITEEQIYEAAAQKLNKAVNEEVSLKDAATSANAAYNEFVPVSSRLFEQLKSGLQLRDSINGKLSELEMHADDMASLILDFTDVRDVQKRFPRSYQAATSIETGINTLISNVVDLNRTQSDTTAATISNEIDFRLKDLNEQFAAIKTETA
ncbi:MAG TPA: MCP four helix bundle domain-containing protein, partial [Rheinheimera sp.]|nr:MCP four helix bundle domain-containing protein [Rheinheimera sp.]